MNLMVKGIFSIQSQRVPHTRTCAYSIPIDFSTHFIRSYSYLFKSVVKSRLQAGSAAAQRYKSALDGLLTIVQEEGIAGLYKGVGNKLIQSVLTAAILFAGQRRIYELMKSVRVPAKFLKNPHHGHYVGPRYEGHFLRSGWK